MILLFSDRMFVFRVIWDNLFVVGGLVSDVGHCCGF